MISGHKKEALKWQGTSRAVYHNLNYQNQTTDMGMKPKVTKLKQSRSFDWIMKLKPNHESAAEALPSLGAIIPSIILLLDVRAFFIGLEL